MKQPTFSIIGGGIAGLTTAIALQRIGMPVKLFEAAATIKPVGAGLGLGTNVLKAFRTLDLEDELMTIGYPLRRFTILDASGKLITRSEMATADGRTNISVHRADLHALLLSKLLPGTFETGKRLKAVNQQNDGVQLFFEDGSSSKSDYLIVADGIHSKVRQQLVPGSKPRYAGQVSWRGVTGAMDTSTIEPSESWGRKGRFGIVPLTDNRVYWFAVLNAPQGDTHINSFGKKELLALFKNYHSPITDIIRQTPGDTLIKGDIQDLKPIHQYAHGRIVLIGDAAHATTPNLAQGACQAIEDAVILANCIQAQPLIEIAFRDFEQKRRKRTHWIVNTSRQIGKIAQLENPILIRLRNALFSRLPASASRRQFQKLEEVDFS